MDRGDHAAVSEAHKKPDGVSDAEWREAMAIYRARGGGDEPAVERAPITLWTVLLWWVVISVLGSSAWVLVGAVTGRIK